MTSAPPTDADRCLLRHSALLSLSDPDAAGFLDKRSNISGWYRYWFSLHGSQLLYFERPNAASRRGLLVGTISLFRHKLTIINSFKRRREFEILDLSGKLHVLRSHFDSQLHFWVQLFDHATNKIPPPHPIAPPPVAHTSATPVALPNTVVDTHVRVDHVMCVVHGIGADEDVLSSNIRNLQDSYAEIMAKVFPDLDFGIELLVVHWRNALTSLDVHQKLHAVLPRAPFLESTDANPLRHIMEHRVVDYVYYTYPRYRRHMLREICGQLNQSVREFRARRPDFNGPISVMGHSLGAALCYDLLSKRVHDDRTLLEAEGMLVQFDAANLFCLGSPLGTLLTLDPTIGASGSDLSKLPFRVVNVFKYHDPIATRVEPLRDVRWADVPPVMVPCWTNMGLRESTAQWFGSLWNSQKSAEEDAVANGGTTEAGKTEKVKRRASAPALAESADSADVTEGTEGNEKGETDKKRTEKTKKTVKTGDGGEENGKDKVDDRGEEERRERTGGVECNGVMGQGLSALGLDTSKRVDYALQLSSAMEEVSMSWSALKSHTEYWGNRDAMLLMVSQMLKTTFGIGDEEDGEARRMEGRIVDGGALERGFPVGLGSGEKRREQGGGEDADAELEKVVSEVVERMVGEAGAMHALVLQHPAVKVRKGAVGSQSPATSSTTIGGGGERVSSWASYLSLSMNLFGVAGADATAAEAKQ